MNPYFTVVVATGNQSAPLLTCLQALQQQQLAKEQFEIVVVDDANHAATASLVESFARHSGIEVRYLAQPRPLGLAAARNRGWRAARGPYIAFTDDDCRPQPGWLLAAQRMFRRGAQVVTGTLHTTRTQPSTGHRRGTRPTTETSDFSAANCFCQTVALQRAGGFEESFALNRRVDEDLQFKLLEIGVPILKCPEAVVDQPDKRISRYAVFQHEREKRNDALLYKRHPDLFRQRMPRNERVSLRYYATIISLVVAFVALLVGNGPLGLASGLVYAGLTAWLAVECWPTGAAGGWETTKNGLVAAIVTPFLTVFWRLHGSVKYRVLYL